MLKILIIQENGRHDDNRQFRECFNFQRSLTKLGVESIVWGLGHENFNIKIDEYIKQVDVVLLLENYDQSNWIPDLSKIDKLKVFWSIDSHCNPHGNFNTVKKHDVNIILNSIESDKKLFQNRTTYYFPNAYPSDLIFPMINIEKVSFLGFCGTPFDYRMDMIKFIESKMNIDVKKDTWSLGNNMVKNVNSYKVHFNYTLMNDINYRVFETMGTNTCLITNEVENINNLFTDMYDIVLYKNKDELLDKLNYLLTNENEIKKVSQRGFDKVSTKHTFDKRSEELLSIINNHI